MLAVHPGLFPGVRIPVPPGRWRHGTRKRHRLQSGVIKTGLGAVRGGEAEQPARVEWDGVASRWRASYPVTGGATSAQFSSWRFTTIASWVVRAMTTIASVSGSGFSSRCGTNGGTKM
jgi:hypothetical protein